MRNETIKTTTDYLEMVRERLTEAGTPPATNYRIAKELGINHACMSRYTNRKGAMDEKTAVIVAKYLNIPEIEVIAATNAEKARDDENRDFWISLFNEKRKLPTQKHGKDSRVVSVGRNGSERVKVHEFDGSKDYRK